ncbi:MAG: N-acetylglucosamine-6-phosphate deacetylase, partial [Acidaminococcaceae bacterium]|nr:N-acetylglucosamine-6-phosphate deacetylase [Acidaminococcaceae bacterium]
NGRLVLSNKILDGCALLFDKKIIGIVSRETLDAARENGEAWNREPLTLTDAQGAYVSPGFVNLHIHGCAGADTMDAKEDTLSVMSEFLAKTGVTAFLPTTMTCDLPAVYKALTRIRESMTVMARRREEKSGLQKEDANRLPGAKVLGAYLEGPFISSAYKGAQKEEYIAAADFELIREFADVIKIAVLAPETLAREQMENFVAQCRAQKIIVSLGHSAAGYEEALQAIETGASHVTHVCNAMTGLHHRSPGLVGAALDSGVTCELIADNLHVHPAVQRLLYRSKGAAELELITDSMRACGLPDGVSELGGQTVLVKDGAARLAGGTLAGSVVTMDRVLANFRKNTGASVPEVVRMVTENQAQELGLFEKIGSLSPGAAADLTIFNEDFTICRTFVDGREVYRNPDFR